MAYLTLRCRIATNYEKKGEKISAAWRHEACQGYRFKLSLGGTLEGLDYSTPCTCPCHSSKCPKCGNNTYKAAKSNKPFQGSFQDYISKEKAMSTATVESPKTVAAPPACVLCKVPFCEVCGLCENAACMLVGKAASSRADLIDLKHILAKTQKARGYSVIAEVLNVPKPFRVVTDHEDIDAILRGLLIPTSGLFVRPCPVRPRHGFVDSRPLKSRERGKIAAELAEVLTEARKADPEAELLVVPTIAASHNVILTPTRLAVGIGNDGATAGKKSTVFPLSGVQFKELPPSVVAKAGVDSTEDPYVEVVLTEDHPKAYSSYENCALASCVFFTQLRAGVRIPPAVGNDFIPAPMKVEKVIEASGDLLEWERQVKEEIKPGTAVYHLGGTLVSHYGVHCVFNNIPIFTSRVPEIGEDLVPTSRPERPSAASVAQGLALGSGPYIGLKLRSVYNLDKEFPVVLTCAQAATFLLVASHNAAAMGGDHGTWLGVAASLMMRLGMAASHGEARHKDDYGKQDRSFVYKLALNDFFTARETLGYAQWRFKNLSWSGGYGGKKWAQCTDSIFRLDKAAQAVMTEKSDDAVTELVTALHNAINQAHNGGWWLNKFVGQNVFDDTSKQSMNSLSIAAPAVLDVASLIADVPASKLDPIIESWATAPVPEIAKGKSLTGAPPKETANEDDEPAPDYDEDDDDDDDDKCGDPSCTECNPPEKSDEDDVPDIDPGAANIAGSITIPLDAEIVEAQGRLVKLSILHVQYKVKFGGEVKKGYLSFNAVMYDKDGKQKLFDKEQALAIATESQQHSWANSGTAYFPLTVSKVNEEGLWKFSNEKLDIHVTKIVGVTS